MDRPVRYQGAGQSTRQAHQNWRTCGPDIRRCRDWHTVTGQAGPITVAAPVLLRVGVSALVLLPGAFGLHFLVDGAEYGSWLYGS
ncbi:DUF6336 family protein [Streptomyces sp. NPDC029041]|uniref:DUF6336 family protein n=1 Tax=Streptomyces sp. NPDC029041 TaxID=3155727 RepID=UPI0033DAB0B7